MDSVKELSSEAADSRKHHEDNVSASKFVSERREKFYNHACVAQFLNTKGDNVKKAAKQLRACLSWRESIGTDHLIADEFSAEIADGLAYVAGHDDEGRPVMIFRMK